MQMKMKTLAFVIVAIVIVGALIYVLLPAPLSPECYAEQLALKQQIEQLNYCTVTEDCEAQALYCPFDCWVFVNRQADFAPVKAQIDAYGSTCGVCQLECPGQPPSPACIEGKCIVP